MIPDIRTVVVLSEAVLAGRGSAIDREVLRRTATEVEEGRVPIEDFVQAFRLRPRATPGELGLEGVVPGLVALVVPAVYSFLKAFGAKIAGKLADFSADQVSERFESALKKALETPQQRQQVRDELRRAFEAESKRLNLPSAHYKTLLDDLDTRVYDALIKY